MSDAGLIFKAIGIQGHSVGSVKFTQDSILWASADRTSSKKIAWERVDRANWAIFGKYAHLRLFMKEKSEIPLRFDGFSRQDFDSLKETLGKHSIKLVREKINCGGGNYGEFEIEDGMLHFYHGDKKTFDINLKQISQCSLPGNKKGYNDVEIQLHETDLVDNATEDCLVGMRLYFPDESDNEAEEFDEDDNLKKRNKYTAESFQEAITNQVDLRDIKGSVLCEIDVSLGTFLTPRGRYYLEMYSSFLRMHGSKYDYKIQYDDIDKLFYLKKSNDRFAFVISLDKPIRQGLQSYHHLVLQTTTEEKSLKINMSEAELEQAYGGTLKPNMSGESCKLIATIFKALSGKPVFITGTYRSASDSNFVKCAMGASEGLLYPLNKSFIFIHKPTKVIGFDEVEYIEFQRYSGIHDPSTVRRSFDLCVICKSVSGEASKEYTFSGIDRSEYPSLYQWCQVKSMRIKNIKDSGEGVESALAKAMEEDEQHEEDIAKNERGDEDESSEADADYAPPSASESEPEADIDGSGSGSGSEKEKEKTKEKPNGLKKSKEVQPSKEKEKQKVPKLPSTKRKASTSVAATTTPSGKKKRKKKDPNAPKGAKSAFMYFCMDKRPEIAKEQPTLKITEISKVLGERWRSMNADDKLVYEERASTDKTRYRSEMDVFNVKSKKDKVAASDDDDDDDASDSE